MRRGVWSLALPLLALQCCAAAKSAAGSTLESHGQLVPGAGFRVGTHPGEQSLTGDILVKAAKSGKLHQIEALLKRDPAAVNAKDHTCECPAS